MVIPVAEIVDEQAEGEVDRELEERRGLLRKADLAAAEAGLDPRRRVGAGALEDGHEEVRRHEHRVGLALRLHRPPQAQSLASKVARFPRLIHELVSHRTRPADIQHRVETAREQVQAESQLHGVKDVAAVAQISQEIIRRLERGSWRAGGENAVQGRASKELQQDRNGDEHYGNATPMLVDDWQNDRVQRSLQESSDRSQLLPPNLWVCSRWPWLVVFCFFSGHGTARARLGC